MKLALEIINREIAQRKLANKHKHLRKEICTKEIEELESVVNLLPILIVSQRSELFCKCTTDTDIYQSDGYIKCQTCYNPIKVQNCG